MQTAKLLRALRPREWTTACSRWRQPHVLNSRLKSSLPGKKEDAFGFNEEEDLNKLLAEGHYRNVEQSPSTPSQPSADKSQDTESKLKKYDEWLKYRQVAKQASNAESTRPSSYGEVRLDSDNVPKQDGQFDPIPKENKNVRFSRKSVNVPPPDESEPKGISAYEFLRKNKLEEREVNRAKSENKRTFEMEDVAEFVNSTNDATNNPSKYEFLDSNTIPRQYQLPHLNGLTHEDMWNWIRKSIIFQNEFVVAINKPYGIPFQNGSRDCRHSVMQFTTELAHHCKVPQVLSLHRLDKDTTGVMVFAKDKKVARVISEKFASRKVRKMYLVVTKNCPEIPSGVIKIPIGEGKVGDSNEYRSVLRPDLHEFNVNTHVKDSKEAITKFKVIKAFPDYAFMEVEPETGLKHQIRVHLGMGLGCPILGDHKYSHRERMAPQRLSDNMLKKLKVKQSKVRELPIHIHCLQMTFDISNEFTDSKEPIFIHAKVPHFFAHTMRNLNISRYHDKS